MYTRSYYPEGTGELTIPENYDGTAFREPESVSAEPIEESPKEELTAPVFKKQDEGGAFSWLSRLTKIGSGGDLFKGFLSDFGTEEILIIGIALFLIFSGSHDIECAIMMLLLLFIK